MSTRLTRTDVKRIAALAHLYLTEDETELFTKQLDRILEYADRLQEVDVSVESNTWHPGTSFPDLRTDTLRPSLARNDALANAPDAVSDGLFRVPKVLG